MKRVAIIAIVAALFCCSYSLAKGPTFTDPETAKKEDPAFSIQGEYAGTIQGGGDEHELGAQVIALGEGKVQIVSYMGGLPGDGWDGDDTQRFVHEGEIDGGKALAKGEHAKAVIGGGKMVIHDLSGNEMGTLERVERKSETLGKEAPEGAVVLFDGKNVDQFKEGAEMSEDGLLMQGIMSKKTFGDHSLHIEFRTPYEPNDRGQQRGNSGIYLQGRYEVQMLDSFGLEGKQNECGGLYSVKDPDINMCFPPLAWQTYDIDYTAARYDDAGKVKSPPRVTVRHNGVVIHDDVELPADRSTTAAPVKPGPQRGPVYVQDHGDDVRYRNIWVVEKD